MMPFQEMAMRKLILVGVTAALLAACATAPQRSEQLEQARTEIQTLSQDPLAQQVAGRDLEASRKSLQQAELALQQKQPMPVVDHLAYLAQRHAQAGEARVSEAHSRQQVAQAQEDRNRILLESRNREIQSAQAQAESAKSQAAAAQTELANMQQQLVDLQAKKTDRGVVVTLGDVLFDTAQATLKPGADLAITRLATVLKNNPQTKIIIEGHTDSRGSDEYNEALSERRADAVATALTARGISPDQFRTRGRGRAYPVASNATPEGRQQNRRVEIVFSDNSGRFARGATQDSPQ
jgi:outer membrane protein OmpA-like peptidoglycan-associated protein